MNAGRKLQLGSTALVAQAAPTVITPGTIDRPDQLERGTEVWIWFRGWRKGRISRTIAVNPRLVRKGQPRGDRAIVMIPCGPHGAVAVRRPLVELLPVAAVPDAPATPDPAGADARGCARALAEKWWTSRDPACA